MPQSLSIVSQAKVLILPPAKLLIAITLFTLAQCAVRISVTPPWGHSDEPGHFEVIRYLVEHRRWPSADSPDVELRRRISGLACRADEPWYDTCLGVTQYTEMPLFYVLQALAQWLVPLPDVIQQLYLARWVSALLLVATGWFAYWTGRELWPHHPLLAFLLPLSLAANFAYVDFGTAVNNDVMAVFSVSVLVFAVVRWMRRGWRRDTVIWLVAGGSLCVLSKTSAWLAIPVAGLAIYMFTPIGRPTVKALILVGMAFAGFGLIMDWNHEAGWNVKTDVNPTAPAEPHVLIVPKNSMAVQVLSPDLVPRLRGRRVTLSGWVYAEEPCEVGLALADRGRQFDVTKSIPARQWQRIELTVQLPGDAQFADAHLINFSNTNMQWDDIALNVEGESENLLVNGDAELVVPMVRDSLLAVLPEPLNSINGRLSELYNWPRARYYYLTQLRFLFSTYWGGWGWNHVSLSKFTLLIYVVVLVGCSGGLTLLWRRENRAMVDVSSRQLQILLWLTILTMAYIVQNVVRVEMNSATSTYLYYSSARHLFPVAVAISALILAGGHEAVITVTKQPVYWRWAVVLILIAMHLVAVQATLQVHLPSFHLSPSVYYPQVP